MKRVIALLLALILFAGVLPIDAAATEQEFVNVQLILDGKPRQYKVIESGSELMFSGEDLAAMGGYEYRVEKGSAYFTRGMKTLRVDLDESRMYPFEDITLVGKVKMAEKVREVDSVYYFPGTEMLPWLNVDCFVLDGQLNICKDEVSIWEIIPVFDPEEFEFDFTACCKELGVNGKYLKARAYLQDKGLTGMFFDIIPVVGDSLDYYDLFEDIVQDQSAADEDIDEMLEDAEDVSYWMEIAEDFEVIEDIPDELRLFGEVANFLSNNAVPFSFEMASYVKNFYQNHENILAAFHSMIVNSGVYKHQLPMTAISALMEVEESYTDYYAGIEYKMMKTIGETAFEGLASVPSGLFEAATTLIGFAEATSPDWAEGINRISSYDMIAEYCVRTYEEMTDHTWMSSIKDMCGLAYMYLYSCEQNWNAMADYAIKEGKLDSAAKYTAMAESTEEWQRKFMEAVSAAMNDSHEYEVVDGSMKRGYTDKLKAMFSTLKRTVNKEMQLLAVHEYSDDGGTIYSFKYGDSGYINEITEYHYGEYYVDSEIDPIDIVHTYEYDELDRLTIANGYNGYDITNYFYNDNGLLERTTSSFMDYIETSYTYDDSNRLVLEEVRYNDVSMHIEYMYDERDELIQVSVEGGYDDASDVFTSGNSKDDSSNACFYYSLMTEHENNQYSPFSISEVRSCASIYDAVGNTIFSLSLSEPKYTTDEFGYLTKIVCEYCTYELYYVDVAENSVILDGLDLSKEFEMLDYAILIGALRDAGLTDIQWDLSDVEEDGTCELLIQASGGDWYSYPLLADMDKRLLWYYTPAGPASSAGWSLINSSKKCAFNDMYGSAAYNGSKYFTWNGNSWNLLAGYERRNTEYDAEGNPIFSEQCEWLGSEISIDDYREKMSDLEVTDLILYSPSLSEIYIVGDPNQIINELDAYISESGRFWIKDKLNTGKIVYFIPSAASIWKTEPSNIAEELGQSYFDCALTLITVDISEESVSLVLSRTYSYEE